MILELVQKILEQKKFECTIAPSTMTIPFDHLLVFLSSDMKKRERILEILGSELQLSPELTLSHETQLPHRLQFRVKLPFKVQDLAANQVASLLLYINQLIDLPGFELNELEGEVIYRYVWITEPSLITPALLMNIVGAIMVNLGLFADIIESLADGKISFNDLLTQIVNIAKSAKTPHN